jgi:hypothetical protein
MVKENEQMVQACFLDLVNYGICRAVSEAVGTEKAKEILRQSGRYNYQQLRAIRDDIEAGDPLTTLENITRFLEEMGYAKRVVVTRVNDNVLEMDMYDISVLDSSRKLVDEGFSPSHFSTNLMFAALDDFGVVADLEELLFDPKENHVKERWTLKGDLQPKTGVKS